MYKEKIYQLVDGDPDKYCKELGEAHCLLWSSRKRLGTLKWNPLNRLMAFINGIEFVFTPDSITNGFCNSKRTVSKNETEQDVVSKYSEKTQELIKRYKETDYTIGSSLIFPISIDGESIRWTMNIARGISWKVHDRIDYTLECIKRYYDKNDDNPLQKALLKSAAFFDLFESFQDYVDFFFLNDLVNDKGEVISFTDTIDFTSPFPKSEEEYYKYLNNTMEFVKKRDARIKEWCKTAK